MYDPASTSPYASHPLVAGQADGPELFPAVMAQPSRYRRRQSIQSYHTNYSKPSQADVHNQNQHVASPYGYRPISDYNTRDYSHVEVESTEVHPQQSVGFWHPRMRKVKKHVFVIWLRTILVLVGFIFTALAMYWMVFSKAHDSLRNLTVHVVDFDGQVAPYNNVEAVVGPVMTNLTRAMYSSSHPSLGYYVVPPAEYHFNPIAVRKAVYNWDAWAAIVISPNATSMLLEAVTNGDDSYDPTDAVQYIIQTARQESTTNDYIVPQLQLLTSQFMARFGAAWSKRLLTNSSFSPKTMAESPVAVNPGVVPLTIDLRPFEPSTAAPAVTTGLIYLIVVTFFSSSILLPIHNKYIDPRGHPPLHFWHLVIWRWVSTVVLYLFASLAYSLVSVAFGVPLWQPPGSATEPITNATAYGLGSIIVYNLINFLGMIALGLASENVVMVVGQRWAALWLIFWMVTNISTSFWPLELAPPFFRWGRGWPLPNVVQASRQIIFDLKPEIVLNFGVLTAWAVINTALFPICCDLMRWRTAKQQKAALEDNDRYVVHPFEVERGVSKNETMSNRG
ncbi:MNNG and nitrosoguanidine resistance protein [Xylaria venustula]|nr:MNNG and nitrosoguanidine resistance protein [Xylaria venustula]